MTKPSPEPLAPVDRAKLRLECLKLAMSSRRDGEPMEQIHARAHAHLAWVLA